MGIKKTVLHYIETAPGGGLKTREELGREFIMYYLDLKEAQARDGAGVGKRDEWELFLQAAIEEGDVPTEASTWKCPRMNNRRSK